MIMNSGKDSSIGNNGNSSVISQCYKNKGLISRRKKKNSLTLEIIFAKSISVSPPK